MRGGGVVGNMQDGGIFETGGEFLKIRQVRATSGSRLSGRREDPVSGVQDPAGGE